jgi:hypothetical protein
MNTSEMEEGIRRAVTDASKRLPSDWTDGIFTALTAWVYKDLPSAVVWCKKNEADPTLSGCLYDFMITEPGETRNDIKRVLVALESEWSPYFEEIKYDFYKLVQSRSGLRVMIFQSRDVGKTTRDLMDILEKSPMSVTGDRYLFAGRNDENAFTFRSHIKG